ncbi:MAG TPA: hypothetical protein PLD20_10985 [Blastocatellia bacterium]|nr:hypothetical protein [Blastocatellia bacterium]HMV85187.1 hypothetical protein [Blastocatellia bacterium]HMX24800.1 hypothetical protein [Blastocatellia bacterium]HMY73521.1 hypothetical protein [Blastocatellia bacterium]HMZ18446.1 hypothetical protein [Blastocatellia bacterium]
MASKSFPSLTECALCGQPKPLKKSHIIPKFFGRELKKKSNSQTLVDGINPQKNPKPQDIAKEFLLCAECEQLFSKWEGEFRNNVIPPNQSLLAPIDYQDWMLKFAVSISWRVLAYLRYAPSYDDGDVTCGELVKFFPVLVPEAHEEAENALETWRLFLLGNKNDIAPYNQHFIMLNGNNFPHENCNAIGFKIFQVNGMIATQALLGQFIILGFIRQDSGWEWKGTVIDPIAGQLGIQQTIPPAYANWLAGLFVEIENVSVEDWNRRHGGK